MRSIRTYLRAVATIAAFCVASPQSISQSEPSTPGGPAQSAPNAAQAASIPVFPPADPKNFTAASPKPETVDAFLRQVWGYDPDRTWRIAGIQSTAAPGVSRVTVFVLERAPGAQIQQLVLMVTPDGNHAIEGYNVIPFGEKPFASTRELLRTSANGPYRGPASKDLELVEFVDLQCPHCKTAQGLMEQLIKDYPKAHVTVELFPLVSIHPSAYKAAKYAVCAQKTSTDAFFKYIHEVFETQEGLAPMTEDALLKAAATRVGLDANAIATCAGSQAARDSVDAQMRLAMAAGVEETPLLVINGRMLPGFNSIPYEQLKKIVEYQLKLDGVDTRAVAETSSDKPRVPDARK